MTILYQESINITPVWFICVIAILVIILLISAACMFIAIDESSCYTAVVCICISLLMLILLACNEEYFQIPSGRNRYEVTIDDDYPFNRIPINYTIIEIRGKIWVLEDKIPKGE